MEPNGTKYHRYFKLWILLDQIDRSKDWKIWVCGKKSIPLIESLKPLIDSHKTLTTYHKSLIEYYVTLIEYHETLIECYISLIEYKRKNNST